MNIYIYSMYIYINMYILYMLSNSLCGHTDFANKSYSDSILRHKKRPVKLQVNVLKLLRNVTYIHIVYY